jgi:hypothetical protein
MKSSLQKIAIIFSSILLIVSCTDSGSSNPGGVIVVPPPNNGVIGQAVKGIIAGATITVQDATGANMALTGTVTTNSDGSYAVTFSTAQVTAGIVGPLIVTVDGTGATTVCDFDNPDSETDDCPVGDGTFATFGASYALPDGFTLHGVIADIPADTSTSDPIVTVNVSPASQVAYGLSSAATGTLTSAAANSANAQVMGLLSAITGINFTGLKLNEIPLTDASAPAAGASAQTLALSAFAAAIIGSQDTTNTTIEAVLASIVAAISTDANGNVIISGNNLANIADQMAIVLASPAFANLPAAQQALQTANQNAAFFRSAGDGDITVSAAEEETDTTSGLSNTKAFIAKLINVINGISATTGAGGIGVTGAGATEAFADALLAVDNLSSTEATQAFNVLEETLISAEASLEPGQSIELGASAQPTALTSNSLTGTVTKSADGLTLTITNVTITVTNAGTGVDVTMTIASGERTTLGDTSAEGASAVFAADDVTVITRTTTTPSDGQASTPVVTVVQTFTGSINAIFQEEGTGSDLGLKTLDFSGAITTAAAGTFVVDLSLSDINGTAEVPDNADGTANDPDVTGNYSATFSFDGLTVNFSGAISANPLNYALTYTDGTASGTDTIMGSVTRVVTAATATSPIFVTDTNIMTDGSSSLTLVFKFVDGSAGQLVGPTVAEEGGDAPAGELTSGTAIEAGDNVYGTVDADGIVRYSDGSIQSLPASIN